MALVLADRVLETCTSPGTGAVTLLGAVTGYQAFSAAVGNANTCYYAIADQNGANWEVGIGTYASAGNTLARTTVLASSNGGSTTNFASGSQNVFLTYPAGKAVSTDTLAYPPAIGGTTPNTGSFTTLTATGAITHNTTTNNQSYTTSGAGTITLTSGTAGTINNFNIGATTSGTGAFTTLSASSTVSGTGFSTYLASPPAIGSTAPNTGSFTTLTATGAITHNTTTNNQSYTTTGAGTITLTSGTAGSINNFNIGATTPGTGAFTSLSSTLDTVATDGFWAKGSLVSTYTDGTVVDYATGNGRISVGTSDNLTFYAGGVANTQIFQIKYTGQINLKPLAAAPTGAAGDIYYNSTTNQFQGYNGTSWLPVGGSVISNDTTTATSLYPLFANATSGTATTIYTSNGNFNFTPSTGELSADVMVASNGLVVNNATVSASYSIAAGNNAMSAGPVSVASGATVTVSSTSVWTVV